MLSYFVIVPIVIAVFLYLFPFERSARIVAVGLQSGLLVAAFYLFRLAQEGDVIVAIGSYYEVLGIILRADALSSVFILLTAFIFLIVTFYSLNEQKSRIFWFLLFIWEGALIGIFLTADFFNVFVLTEVATVVVTVLIMYRKSERSMYDGIIYFMINVVVMQFYLLGLGYLYRLVGVMDMEEAAVRLSLINYYDSNAANLPYVLIMTFVALKCALVPLFSWLPKAHSTPGASSAASAVLSGLHIKSGVYLFLRVQATFSDIDAGTFFVVLGLITAAFGVTMALSQRDIKRILAYSTIAQIGLIFVGLNTGSAYNFMGGLYHMINHALFKAALFLSVGMISYAYGTRNVNEIRGVLRRMPLVGVASIMAILGMVGMPFFNGSISKYFLMHDVSLPLNVAMTVINLGTIMVFIKFSAMLFGGEKIERVRSSIWEVIPILVLGVACLVFGIFGGNLIEFLFGWEAQIDPAGYLEKSIVFAVSSVAGYFIFNYWLRYKPMLARIAEIDLGFRGMCAAMGVFVAALLLVIGF